MAKIYRTTDRIAIRIDDVTIKIAPLTVDQKAEIQEHMLGFYKGDIKAATKGMFLAVKYAVKGVDGVEDADGTPFVPAFEGDVLADETVDALFNLECSEKMGLVCTSLMRGIPKEFTDIKGNVLTGVEFVDKGSTEKKP